MTTEQHIKHQTKDFKVTSQQMTVFNTNLRDTSTRLFKIIDKEGNKLKLLAFTDRISIEVPVATKVLFSIGIADNICLANKLLTSDSRNKIYTDQSNDSLILKCIDLTNQELEKIAFQKGEGLFVYKNAVQLVVNNTRTLTNEFKRLNKIRDIIQNNFPDTTNDFDASKIPQDFKVLIPLINEWAISDDLERSDKIEQSSKVELKNVIDIVGPKMAAIEIYLDSFENETIPYEATLIGSLAELVAELKLDDKNYH